MDMYNMYEDRMIEKSKEMNYDNIDEYFDMLMLKEPEN